jgi:hypothetical protein
VTAHAVGLVTVALVFAMLAVRLEQMPEAVTGVDGGDWLAFAAEQSGIHAKGAPTAYPPLFPSVTAMSMLVLPPLVALRLSGVAASLLPGLGAYWLLRSLGLRWAALPGLLLAETGYAQEMLAWGGYPQLLGTGLVLGAQSALVLAARTRSTPLALLAGGLGGLAVQSQQLTGLQAIVSLGVASVALWVVMRREARSFVRLGALVVISGIAAASPSIPAYLRFLEGAGSSEVLNTQGYEDPLNLLAYVVNEAPVVWALAAGVSLASCAAIARRRQWIALSSIVALAAASLGLAAVTHEVRCLYLGQAVPILAAALLLSRPSGSTTRLALRLGTVVLLALIVWSGQQRFDRTRVFYTVLDPSVVDAFEWLDRNREPGDLAASAPAWRNWPLGWWLEGIGHVPAYVESDERWVFFREEREQARIARGIFSTSNPQAAAVEAQKHGITLLVIDTRDNGRADQWIRSGRVHDAIGLVYANPSITIFRVSRGPVESG